MAEAGPVDRPRLLVVHPGAELYGSDRMLLESVTGMVEAGADVVVALGADGPLAGLLRDRGARAVVRPLAVLRRSALSPAGVLAWTGELLRAVRPALALVRSAGRDGVHVSTLTLPLWAVLARLCRRRLTVHVHEAESAVPRPLWAVLALPATLAHRTLVNSRFTGAVLGRASRRAGRRSVVVRNGVGGPTVVSPPRPALHGPVRLLFVGRLSARKGPQVAVAVAGELLRRGHDVRLDLLGAVFAGNEAFDAGLRRDVAARGLQERVTFLGLRADVYPALADHDVVLVPSLVDESFGNTAVEALLAARPVVVSAAGGLAEAVEGCRAARTAPPGDVAAWADAVGELLADWPATVAASALDSELLARRHRVGSYRAAVVAALDLPAGDPCGVPAHQEPRRGTPPPTLLRSTT